MVPIAFFLLCSHNSFGQHDHLNMPAMKDSASKEPKKNNDMSEEMTMRNTNVPMSHSLSLNLPEERNGSGTGWLPDSSPMYGVMYHSKKWMYMLHGSFWLRYNRQDFTNAGERGDSKFDAPSWLMFMGQRRLGTKGLFHFSTMFSLDPIIEGGKGYPLLFQTGETYKGTGLVDRQHPHDLFSELAISYSYSLSKNSDVFAYLGYPGEPALGPVTFMHRPSALDNPNAPISHHWVDATHITFGVATLGVRFGKMKIEASLFTGKEPDEARYGFDKPRFDSWSGRISYNPSATWAFQVSHGYVKSPEILHPGENIYKTTASAIYSKNLTKKSHIDATLLWGMNKQKEAFGENAILAESAWRRAMNSLYVRYEWTQKSAEELLLGSLFNPHTVFDIHSFTVGDSYDLFGWKKLRTALGGQWSFNCAPRSLNYLYGKNPMGFQIYLRLYPSQMKM